jgi:hypothetical protein
MDRIDALDTSLRAWANTQFIQSAGQALFSAQRFLAIAATNQNVLSCWDTTWSRGVGFMMGRAASMAGVGAQTSVLFIVGTNVSGQWLGGANIYGRIEPGVGTWFDNAIGSPQVTGQNLVRSLAGRVISSGGANPSFCCSDPQGTVGMFTGNGNLGWGPMNGTGMQVGTWAHIRGWDGRFLIANGLEVTGDIGHTGGVWNMSDERIKQNIRPSMINALDILNKLNVVQFDWRPEHGTRHEDIGLTAQQVGKYIPDAVKEFPADERHVGSGLKGIRIDELVFYLVRAVQQLSGRLEALER